MALVTNSAVSALVAMVESTITHIGIGNGAVPLSGSSILLNNEVERKPADVLIDGDTVVAEVFWDETEANGVTYTEAGSFYDSATDTIDTGTLFSGGQISIVKDETITLTVSIEITVEAVNS